MSLAACGDDDSTNPPRNTAGADRARRATRPSDGISIEVTWTAVTGATSYVLERAEASRAGRVHRRSAATLTAPTYTDTDIVAGDGVQLPRGGRERRRAPAASAAR